MSIRRRRHNTYVSMKIIFLQIDFILFNFDLRIAYLQWQQKWIRFRMRDVCCATNPNIPILFEMKFLPHRFGSLLICSFSIDSIDDGSARWDSLYDRVKYQFRWFSLAMTETNVHVTHIWLRSFLVRNRYDYERRLTNSAEICRWFVAVVATILRRQIYSDRTPIGMSATK